MHIKSLKNGLIIIKLVKIVGYRIDPPSAKVSISEVTPSRPSTKNRYSSSRLIAATKQIRTLVNLNTAATRRAKTT